MKSALIGTCYVMRECLFRVTPAQHLNEAAPTEMAALLVAVVLLLYNSRYQLSALKAWVSAPARLQTSSTNGHKLIVFGCRGARICLLAFRATLYDHQEAS